MSDPKKDTSICTALVAALANCHCGTTLGRGPAVVRMLMDSQSIPFMPEETPTPPPASSTNPASAIFAFIRGLSFSRIQSVVATLAGIVSVGGAAFSVVQYVRPSNSGELVAVVKAAGSQGVVSDATVEVLTTEDALVATLTPDSAG